MIRWRGWFVLSGLVAAALVLVAGVVAFEGRVPLQAYPSPAGAIVATGPRSGETYSWRPVAIGGGGFITGLATDANGTAWWARSDVHGAYRWDKSADRWRLMVSAATMPTGDAVQNGLNEGVYAIAVAPHDQRRTYMALKGRVYRSDDGGDHWTSQPDASPFPLRFDPNSEFRLYGPFLSVSPDDADTLFFGTPENGLFRSNDGARSWAHVPDVPPSADLRPAAGIQAPGSLIWFQPGKIPSGKIRRVWVASARHGVFVSDDGGKSFHATQGGPSTVIQAAFLRDGSFLAIDQEAGSVWINRAGKWADLGLAGGIGSHRYQAIAVDPANDHTYLVDEGGKGWCSADGGAHWTGIAHSARVGTNDPPWLHVADQGYFATGPMRFDPVIPHRLWMGAGTGVYYADVGPGCGDLRLVSQARGIEELVANDAVQPPGRAPLFAAWDFGIHLKPDLDRFSATYGPRERVLIAAQQIDWSASSPGFLVTNASDTRTGCCSEDGDAVMAGYSTDGGRSWTKFAFLPQPPGTRADDPWRMAFGTIAVSADSTDNIVWEPAFDRSPFYTLDRGRTWHRVELDGETLPLTGSFRNFYGNRKTLAADRVKAGTFYLMHSGTATNPQLAGIWRTGDGGRSWQHVYRGELAPHSEAAAKLRAVPGKAGHLFFTSDAGWGSDTRLRRSIDGGVSWQALDHVDHVDDIAFGKAATGSDYPTIFVSGRIDGRYGVWRSTDDAKSWRRLIDFPLGRLDQVTVMEGDKDVFGRVYLGYMGSGWIYGEPAACKAAPLEPGDDRQCRAVDR